MPRPRPSLIPDMKARRPTLADVARRARVSTATVSRCLNAPDRVADDTRGRVMAAVNALGYAPNFQARALAANRTNMVGVVIPTMENAVFARGIQAFQEELGSHGMTLLIASSSYREDLEAAQIRTLVARGADALLLIGYHRDRAVYEFLDRRGVPALVAWSYDDAIARPAIGFDNVQAMAALARKAIGLGHARLAMISAPIAVNDRARGRVEGARLAMREAGLPGESLTLIETQYGIETGAAALRAALARAPGTTAVLCGNDVLAIGALLGARQLGLRVPEDLSITGFDGIALAKLAEPGLTTVHVPHKEMGRRAARMIVSMLNGADAPRRLALPVRVKIRASLGPPPKAGGNRD